MTSFRIEATSIGSVLPSTSRRPHEIEAEFECDFCSGGFRVRDLTQHEVLAALAEAHDEACPVRSMAFMRATLATAATALAEHVAAGD